MQIIELLKLEGLSLYHHDLPFFFKHWRRTETGSGLDAADCEKVNALVDLPRELAADCIYRIASPYRPGEPDDDRRTVTFMVTELGLGAGSFAARTGGRAFFTQGDNCIVTPSVWARRRIIDYGFPAAKVSVVPHGVDCDVFTPLGREERVVIRANMGIRPDEVLFVNVGVAMWNKGIDLLLRAFAALRARGRPARLILKDQSDLYGVSVIQMLQSVGARCPELLREETIAAISIIGDKLERGQLRALYGIADAYVSPYRAEGFNLPVLEAIACGTPVIVTQGGATDDFCDADVAMKVAGVDYEKVEDGTGTVLRYIEPDWESLVSAMDEFAARGRHVFHGYEAARALVLAKFTWRAAAVRLAEIMGGADFEREP